MTLRELKIERKKRAIEPTISVSKRGNLYINKAAVDLMAGKFWERVGLFNDADAPNNWYISVSDEGVKVSEKKDKTLRGVGADTYHKRLSQQFGISGVVRFTIHPQPADVRGYKYYRLIVKK